MVVQISNKLEKIILKERISKEELLLILKEESRSLPMQDIMLATSFLKDDAKYMPAGYREEYIEHFSKAFFLRIKDIKEDNEKYHGYVKLEKLKGFLDVLKRQRIEAKSKNELSFLNIARIISIYTTFIREEPIHPVGTKFPGGFIIRFQDGKYLCPVKERQLENPSALCRFCVSIQDENI
jgi:uncharacterized protein (UPF0305 family)